MSNFQFLESHWTDLAKLGDLSEKYVYSDPNTSIIKQGMLSEVMVKYMLAYDGIAEPAYDNTHANRIRILKNNDLLPREIDNTLYILRKSRNDAAHNAADEGEKALNNLQLMYELCVWYMQTYGDYNYEPTGYVQPVDMTVCLADLEKENAELEERNQQLLIEIEQIQKNGRADSKRRTVAYQKALNVHLSEAQTRELIDEQLRKVGWEANTTELRYSNGTRPTKGKNLAIAEWPTDSNTGNNGYADYALFIGEKLVGIVEAKKKHTNISSVLDGQCKDYAKMIKSEHQKYVINRFGAYMVPFLYATNGRPYIKQYEQMSGIWCLDVREPFNAPKALSGWSTPEGIEQALEKDIVEADKKLAATGYEVLQDPDGLNLRYYQIEAIQAAEKAIAEHKQTALLAMATGTGKTRTVLGMIYRFLDAGRFKRILYLVDRTSLGDQTMDTFKEVKLKELLTLNQMYDVKSLEDKEFEKDTRVHIATVQSLVKRIMYNESDKSLGVSDYDMVIVDEAHRGYILDKEMGDDEILYRDQNDFRSKYRAVIDYFDAVKIALTATPALHTTEIFGKPVYSYDYRTAVIDGFLVDHDAPHIIKTKLSEEGISFEKGSTVPIYDPVTNEITNSSELEDDLKFEVEDFNRRVVDKSFNETVLQEKDVLSVVKTVAGNHERNHYSQRQIDVIKNEIIPKYVSNPEETGIIAPYKNQVEALSKEITDIDAATVHKFQGKEKENIIISTVDDEISDFADDPYLINVAVSRAKKKLMLVVTGNEQSKEHNITDLIDYIQYNNFEVTESKIYSIFDYLYKQYTEERRVYLQKHKKVSEYDSENLMYSLIEDIISASRYSSLDVVCHFPLNMLIKNPELLNEQECQYAMNPATHLDFLIYNRIGKKPVLAIEVDGYEYHKEDTVQASRDLLKNHIMELYEIPLLRFMTNGSGEREKIVEMLDKFV